MILKKNKTITDKKKRKIIDRTDHTAVGLKKDV